MTNNIFDSIFDSMNSINASHKVMIEEGIRIGLREAMAELHRNTEFCESLEQYRRAVNITLKRFGEIGHDQ